MHATLGKIRAQPLLIVKFLNKLLLTPHQNLLISGTILLSRFLLIQMIKFIMTPVFSTGKFAYAFAALKSWQPQQQREEMKKAGLHSSLLSPFLDDHDTDHPHALPYTDPVFLDPYTEEHHETLVNTLDLDSPTYSNISENVMSNFRNLLRRYPEAFHIPGSLLGTIKGFYHNIDTGESPPVYKLPYRKSPAELLAIKAELERMFALNIIRPSHCMGDSLHLSAETTRKKFIPAP